MVKSSAPTSSVVRGVLSLSAGTLAVQTMSAIGQLVLAFWLSPVDYGYWAAATSVLAIATGLVNLGEVHGYLSTPFASFRRASGSILRANLLLMLIGFLVGASYYLRGQGFIALLIVLCSLNFPLLGESNLLYAYYVKSAQRTRLVAAQFLGALVRLTVGVIVAWATASAIAFAVSMLAYSAVLVAVLRFGYVREEAAASGVRASVRQRFAWASLSAMQMLASQVDYLVVSLVSTPELLGVYFFSYQVTIGLGTVLAGPLSKSALSELAREVDTRRRILATELIAFTVGGVGIVCAVGAILLLLLRGFLPHEWQSAVPVIVICLGSVPARFVTPITDAVQMAGGRWWRSTSLSGADMVGTALVALVSITGNVVWLAAAVVCWKVLFSLVRYLVALPSLAGVARSGVAVYLPIFAGSMVVGGLDPDRFGVVGPALGVLAASLSLLSSLALSRGHGRRSEMPGSHETV